MAKDFKEADGSLEMFLDCPECDFEGIIYYISKPPEYCCNACKQRAYRRRHQEKRNIQAVTLLLRDLKEQNGFNGKLLAKMRDIAATHGPDAAQAAADAVLFALEEEKAKRRRL